MGAQACTNAALRHSPALRVTSMRSSHTSIKYLAHSALHANGPRPRTAIFLLTSPSGQRYRYNAVQETAQVGLKLASIPAARRPRRSRITAPVSGSSAVPGLLRSQLQRNSQQQGSAHPFRNLLVPAAALLLLSKVIDGKGMLSVTACSATANTEGSSANFWSCMMQAYF